MHILKFSSYLPYWLIDHVNSITDWFIDWPCLQPFDWLIDHVYSLSDWLIDWTRLQPFWLRIAYLLDLSKEMPTCPIKWQSCLPFCRADPGPPLLPVLMFKSGSERLIWGELPELAKFFSSWLIANTSPDNKSSSYRLAI